MHQSAQDKHDTGSKMCNLKDIKKPTPGIRVKGVCTLQEADLFNR